MAVWSEVHISCIPQDFRVDPEYYQPKYLDLMSQLDRCNTQPLKTFIYPIQNGLDYREFSEDGTPYIRVGDIHDGRIHIESAVKVPIRIEDVTKDIALRTGDILFTRKGTFGQAAIVRKGGERIIISSEIMLLRLRNEIISDGTISAKYLSTFLNSQVGYLQVKRQVHGMAYYSISQSDLADISVLVPSEHVNQAITQYVSNALSTFERSKVLYAQAEALLLEELGLTALDSSHQLAYEQNFSRTQCGRRYDAEYFQPKYQQVMTLIGQSGQCIKDVVKLVKRRFRPEAGKPFEYIEIGDISSNGQVQSKPVIGEDAPSRATWIVHPDDVITSTVRPIRRLSAIIVPEQDGFVCSSGFAVLKPKDIEPQVLLVFLRLPIICEILNLYTTASMYPAISTTDLLSIPITLPSRETRRQIAEKVTGARQADREARHLLEEAKRRVEQILGEE